jgi:acetylornithine deacetylase
MAITSPDLRLAVTDPRLSTTEMLARLVAFDTTSRNSNIELIDWVRTYLEGLGVPCRISRDPTGRKANLHAVIGPYGPGGIALSGHVDTVPVDGQAWSSDPFTLRAENGRLYGRGTTDMKGFVASSLAAVPDLLAAGLTQPVHLFITHDEETDMSGARGLVRDIVESGLRPAMCVVGEPSSMQPINAHKGRLALRVIARGAAGHSSQPAFGVNALYAAAQAIVHVQSEAARFAANGPFAPGFDPPHTTTHVGTLQGGSILNIIPERAEFTMEWRTIPGDDFHAEVERLRGWLAENLEPGMRRTHPDCGFTLEVMDFIPGLSLAPDDDLVGLVQQLTGFNSVGQVSYGTEGGLYQQAGIPTIVCGPGDIAQAHKPDEFIAVSQLDACDAFIRRLASKLAA